MCQSSTQALCGVNNNLNISCHNSHRLHWHVHTCQHQLQPKSTSFVYKLCVYAHLHQSPIIYRHVRTCQHLSLTFQLMHGYIHINRQHCLVDNNLNVCIHVGFNASHHHVCTSTTCMSKHIYYKVSVCIHVRTFLHCLRSLHVRTCQSWTQALCGVDNNLNISGHNSHHLYWHVYTCQHQLQPK